MRRIGRPSLFRFDDPGLAGTRQKGADGQSPPAIGHDLVWAQKFEGILVSPFDQGPDTFQLATSARSSWLNPMIVEFRVFEV